ncbi:MAG: alpha-amylase family glycosyl hydrolase [Saccharofermentans sp.]|nr:alpha-amylase family glycosyl hydrolase [Saccharofermentans sp.]
MAWYDEAVFYHIYPLGLLGAEKQNSYGEVNHRLRELDPWITHIKEAGFNAIYIGPLFESVGHGYETTDYKKLDSRLGDNKDLKNFVAKCHKNGIRVIFDGVFNHTGRDFFAFQDIKANRENSRYRDWYCNVNFWGNNEYNDGFSYDNWGGYNLLVKLNQRNGEVRDYIADVIRFWVSEFDVDGIRLDAADVLDFDFMKMLRWVASEVKPDFWLMGEVIHGEYSRWVNEGTLHSVTNYHLHKALYSGHNEHNYFEIAHTVKRLYGMAGNDPNRLKLYNFSDNHDVERIYTKLNNKAHYAPVHILTYTLPGIPSMYYGSEFGIEGRKERGSDDSLRPALNIADFKDSVKNNPMTALIAKLGFIKQNVQILNYGDYREAVLTNRQYAYVRNLDGQSVVVTLNNDDNDADINVNGIPDGEYVGAITGARINVGYGHLGCRVAGNSGEVWIPAHIWDNLDPKAKRKAIPKTKAKAPVSAPKEAPAPAKVAEAVAEGSEPKASAPKASEPAPAPKQEKQEKTAASGKPTAADKYGLDSKYAQIIPEEISSRGDYDAMSIEELQVAILEKMAKNGPVNDQMIRTVMDNVYPDSLKNWVKSFR